MLIVFFRTVWHELLVGDWPFKKNPPEVIIWQVGRGLKPSLGTLTGSKDLKVCPLDNIVLFLFAFNWILL